MSRARPVAGFTLLELLVALAVFAVLATVAYAGVYQVLQVRDRTEDQARRLDALRKSFALLQRDLEQAAPRPVRDAYGDILPAFRLGAEGALLLELTRGGWTNPAGRPRSTLRRVGLELRDGRLRHLAWRVLDRAQDSEPVATELVAGVSGVEVECLDADGNWVRRWPPPRDRDGGPDPSALPRAVRLTLVLETWGRFTRLFRLPGAGPEEAP
ncbi:type II secretion system minor pseudopilin GspJ [Thioalbus denitrificans]|uniref:Type II secretion system protein J n=1 Tax=Thioalbus denitrificans TaxID=547122 RepID=A0A369CEL1_9GAMM|nr:type II secretion system minor pseudopilin GspJ [Thioalbus denitrificans]RCX31668.1 general secretion pathway protein J [Thioalbus denitrificans]